MRLVFILMAVLFPLLLAAQSESPRFVEYTDLCYGLAQGKAMDSLQCLNLVLPANKQDCPLLIWIGGGAWSYVDRHVEMEVARQFAVAGIAVASLGHRLSPATWRDSSLSEGITHPAHIEDVAMAVRWLWDHAHVYKYDRTNMFIGGFSSGAHLATLLCLDSTYLETIDLSPRIFKGIIPVSGTYDIPHYRQILEEGARPELAGLHVDAVFGSGNDIHLHASPSNYLVGLHLPMLIITDGALEIYTRYFEEKLREVPFSNYQVVYAHEHNHAGLWRDLARAENSLYRDLITAFIRKHR